jgi:hypothetical protein
MYQADVQMLSPRSHDLQGASHITGGTVCGCAHGNVFNFTDEPDVLGREDDAGAKKGKILLYTEMGDLEKMKPMMSLKHPVVLGLAPILIKLANWYT